MLVVGVEQGLLSPDRFDARMGLDLLQWLQGHTTKFVQSGGELVRAVREIGDVAIVLVAKKGSVLVQFRHKSAPDDFNAVP